MPTAAPPIGKRLRKARQERQLSIEESAWRTRIRPDLLRALEREQFGALDHAGFVRRHLASYARFLGLDPLEIVDDYATRYEPDDDSSIEHLDRREKQAKKPPRPRWHIAAAVSGALLVAAAAVGVLGGHEKKVSLRALSPPTPRVAGPSAASRLAPARVTMRLLAVGATHVSVIVDGVEVFEGDVVPGEARSFAGRLGIEIVAGNGAAVRLVVNGAAVPAGKPGSVYRARFGPLDPAGR